MGRTCWIAGMVMTTGLAIAGDASAQSNELLTLEVLVCDHVDVPGDVLRRAQDETSRIFASSGIRLVWVSGRVPRVPHITIQIISNISNPPSRKAKNPDMLGLAARAKDEVGVVAWLFYNRIDAHRRLFDMEASLMMGHVMAHEMGHLLLPYGTHTLNGLMKGGWDKMQAALAAEGKLTFDRDETAQIRARLQRANESLIPNP